MAETQILGWGTASAPSSRVTKAAEDFTILAINATLDGTAAGSSFLPCVEIVSDAGQIVARCPADTAVSAGGSAEVTFAPFLRAAATGGTSTGIQFDTTPQTGGFLVITTTGTVPATGDGLRIHDTNGINFQTGDTMNIESDQVMNLTSDNGDMVIDAGGQVQIKGQNDVTIQPLGDANVQPSGATNILGVTGVTITVGNGQTFTVTDHFGAPKIQWTEGTTDLHIPTGGTVVADL